MKPAPIKIRGAIYETGGQQLVKDLALAWYKAEEDHKESLMLEAETLHAFHVLFPGLTVHERKLLVDGEHVIVQGNKHALVESKSRPGEYHAVSFQFNAANGLEEWCCSCESWNFRHDCRHVRAADLFNAGKATVSFEDVE